MRIMTTEELDEIRDMVKEVEGYGYGTENLIETISDLIDEIVELNNHISFIETK